MTSTQTGGQPLSDSGRSARLGPTDLRSIAVFLVLAFGLAWLVTLPLWLGDGLTDPAFLPLATVMMTTPAIAALVVLFVVERPAHKWQSLGLWPLRPLRRLCGYIATGIAVSMALVLVALPIGALLGVYPADFTHFSTFRQALESQLGPDLVPASVGPLITAQLALVPVAALIGVLPALGEEIGWRGWLLPKLMPLGAVPAILVSGVIWGTWHAPVVLLGYNYSDAPGWLGVASMVGMCTVVGAVFGWLRLRSGSVWPAALAHSAFNATGASFLLFAQAGVPIDTTRATILGWSGWIVPLALVALLVATGRFAAPARPDDRDRTSHHG
ncbi:MULTISPECIES: CPBP family intramembrane glutamic endopeptidase [Pseudonocardia]|uniref:CAAX amino terminal protease self-immunity n=2 Tax=Pseudonocardia TaxID=1847 RepID=A0A1Y2MGM2_PSEAH|nr:MULTISPECIES: CPBP family intramembrane glutamic endopeptidase [Pseudonocardia]OSY34433.1 CAAX amino terminal protease self- immunity [Pseudonocardia autotrophica]TDN72007.1 CAAX prenyl protease-like protein [Pseudonocardia autotrophica]BBG02696.1 abortive infection protein [Pseudonocardia autotrophica]GEC29729.1 abortive infection protein [Pseudonocardia saturnea]